ncbi:MAG: NUDIX hydrolase [Devosiaceae bacterium]|nr:NUDIX hydrolase [Devosiaceae bacterium MH13]
MDLSDTNHPRVLMGRRPPSARFMPNVTVFPGGAVERTDGSAAEDRHLAAAFRECREETGLVLDGPDAPPAVFIARAVTPPAFTTRYDTLFFLQIWRSTPPSRTRSLDGELHDIRWWRASGADAELDGPDDRLHHVTRAVLRHALAICAGQAPAPLLVADRTPRGWQGQPALRARNLRRQAATLS